MAIMVPWPARLWLGSRHVPQPGHFFLGHHLTGWATAWDPHGLHCLCPSRKASLHPVCGASLGYSQPSAPGISTAPLEEPLSQWIL